MQPLTKLKPYEQKEIINGLLFDGYTYSYIEEKYGVSHEEIAKLLDEKAFKPYLQAYPKEQENEEGLHKTTFFQWIKFCLWACFGSYFLIVLIQGVLGGFSWGNISSSLLYITQPLSKLVSLSLGMVFILLVKYYLFPILSKFINYKVNTVYLQDEFMKADSKSKLNFLGIIFLSLCILVGLVFSSSAQSKRDSVIKYAYKEIGVVEHGGNNRGKKIDFYRSIALGKTVKNYSDAWCGYFVAYVYRMAKVNFKVGFSPRARDWFTDESKIVWRRNFKYGLFQPKPQRGDVIGYVFRAGTIGHIEILAEWKEKYFLSIGGNTSNSNTVYRDNNNIDGVKYKKRLRNTAYVISNHID